VSIDALPSGGSDDQELAVTSQLYLLTVHEHLHVLHETIDALQSLRCCRPSLVLRESIQPLQHRFDFILSKELLYEFHCATFRSSGLSAEVKLTWSALVNLFGHQGKSGK
jgi:hypothetical protein